MVQRPYRSFSGYLQFSHPANQRSTPLLACAGVQYNCHCQVEIRSRQGAFPFLSPLTLPHRSQLPRRPQRPQTCARLRCTKSAAAACSRYSGMGTVSIPNICTRSPLREAVTCICMLSRALARLLGGWAPRARPPGQAREHKCTGAARPPAAHRIVTAHSSPTTSTWLPTPMHARARSACPSLHAHGRLLRPCLALDRRSASPLIASWLAAFGS